MTLKEKICSIFKSKGDTARKIAERTNIPKSTVHYHQQLIAKRIAKTGTDFCESDIGYQFTIRLVVSAILVFGIKSGNGAGRFKDFFEHLKLEDYLPSSETTILWIIKRIKHLILEYRESAENQIHCRGKEMELILGVEETWFDKMYLVCQELSSGFVFFETDAEQRDAATWSEHIKKTLYSAPPCCDRVLCQ